ncbi:MAG TPA: hypothetical protein PLU25_10195, partial [Acidobacteriota bacterium]|nr:hypothetical protein [Acidobacteriota bacterium]
VMKGGWDELDSMRNRTPRRIFETDLWESHVQLIVHVFIVDFAHDSYSQNISLQITYQLLFCPIIDININIH